MVQNFACENNRTLQMPGISRRWFYRIAKYPEPVEHTCDVQPWRELIEKLKSRRVDLFGYIERSFLHHSTNKKQGMFSCVETIGLLKIESFDSWFKALPQRERSTIRKTQRKGLKTCVVDVDEDFVKGAFQIYNETPMRQGRKYSGYGLSLDDVRGKFLKMDNSEVMGAYLDGRLIGLMLVEFGDRVAAMSSFLSLISQRKMSPNNALIAQAVKRCSEKGYRFFTYGNMGYNPSLDFFKKNNGFKRYPVTRYYAPLTAKGQLAVKLKLCQPLEHSFSPTLTQALIPFYNTINKMLPAQSGNPDDA
ncbi:MAG: GNAT family N-acetyltransferase [Candidatus Bathyarchaeota archaeon]|nr:GNAT family N-acetyltransferase [Candidatus Bathyarchaeota archaeon]